MVSLCYGTFFTVLSAFKRDSLNVWQLHNRLMNVEYVPFGDEDRRFPLTADEFSKWYAERQSLNGNEYDSGNQNMFERINDFANCKKTKSLPIQKGTGLQHRFVNEFLGPNVRLKILQYVQTQVVIFLDENKSVEIVKSIIEFLMLSDISPETEFFIDTNPTSKTTKKDVSNRRTRFNLANLIAGVLYYIVKECMNNTIGKDTIDAWNGNPPNGKSVSRMIVVVEPDFFAADEETPEDKKYGSYIDNRGANIDRQTITNIGTVNGNINLN